MKHLCKVNRIQGSTKKSRVMFENICSRFLSFGAGRRICPGENMTKNHMFLFLTSYLQHFTIEADVIPPKTDPRSFEFGIVLIPQDYKLKAIQRNSGTTLSQY